MKKTIFVSSLTVLAGLSHAGIVNEVESNNTLATANALGSFGAPGGSLIVDGVIDVADVDYFSFTLDDDASLSIFAAFSTTGGGDGVMQLLTAGGDVIAFDDGSGFGLMPALQIMDLSAGDYAIALSGFGDVDAFSVDSDELADGLGHDENFGYKLSIGFSVVPNPSSLALLSMGGLVATRRRR